MNTTGNFLVLDSQHPFLNNVLELDHRAFPRPWSQEDWKSINWDHHQLYVWLIEQEVAGFALFGHLPGDDVSHLLKICIEPRWRGQHHSSSFWGTCLNQLKLSGIQSIYLEVEAHNQRAIGFYQKQGFTTLRNIKSYYSDGADALTMQLTL